MKNETNFTNLCSDIETALVNGDCIGCYLTTANNSTLELELSSCEFEYDDTKLKIGNEGCTIELMKVDIDEIKKEYDDIYNSTDYWFKFNGSFGSINIIHDFAA